MASDNVRMLYAGAVNYADGAQLIISHSAAQGRDGLILPTHTLMGLAIELLFKAVFLHRVGDPKDLQKVSVRHNLNALRGLTRAQGFKSGVAQIDEIIEVIGGNYADHDYRYMKSGGMIRYVEGAGAVPAIQRFVDEVAVELGLPVRPDAK
jgi:hypothetical protein